jgi:hypothetical protein
MPTKKRSAIKPLGVVTRPAIAVGIEPQSKRPMKTSRGPKRSHSGPAMNRTRNLCSSACLIQKNFSFNTYVARRATMFEFATCCCVI